MGADDLSSKATELVRKLLIVGVGTIFLTEESLRLLVQEFKLPKDLITGILDSAAKTKNEFLGRLSDDILSRVMDKVEPKTLVEELLRNNTVELSVKVNFKPKG